MHVIKPYYTLTKPGIVYGNALPAIAGFFLAAKGDFNLGLFVAILLGQSLVIASACVFNNHLDQEIDSKMERTKKRALVTGIISGRNALTYGAILGVLGFGILGIFTNRLTLLVGLIGWVFYVIIYGYAKRKSIYGTLVGSIPGATPPVAGYVAVTGHLDAAAIILFMIMVFWQMPHFYAIAMYRRRDYAAAGIPVWSVVRGMRSTKVQIMIYAALFIMAALLLAAFSYAGYVYVIVITLLGARWLQLGLRGFKAADDGKWAHKMFGFSLVVLLVMCVTISLQAILI